MLACYINLDGTYALSRARTYAPSRARTYASSRVPTAFLQRSYSVPKALCRNFPTAKSVNWWNT